MIKRILLLFSISFFAVIDKLPAPQIQVIDLRPLPRLSPEPTPFERLLEGFSEQERQQRLQKKELELRKKIQLDERIATEIDHYDSVLSQLSYEPAHPTLHLSEDLSKLFSHRNYIKTFDDRIMSYVFKRKFNRILSDGTHVEWLWSLEISNETQKKFLSFGGMEYPRARFIIELLDANNFSISSCIYYTNLFLKRGESTILQGKWVIPYDQVSEVLSYKVSIENP